MENKFRSRKFYVMVSIQVLFTLLLAIGTVNANQYIDITKWNVGLYFASNVGDKVAQKNA